MRKVEMISGGIGLGLLTAGILGLFEYEINANAQKVACNYGSNEEYQICEYSSVDLLNNTINQDNELFVGLGVLSATSGFAVLSLTSYMIGDRRRGEAGGNSSNSI